jgi:hypothetical protein
MVPYFYAHEWKPNTEGENMTYLLNAFSLQMVREFPATITITEVPNIPNGLTSAIGHPDTAKVLGVEHARVNVTLGKGDTAYVAQLQGGRLPEGATTLPEGFSFKFLFIEVLDIEDEYNDEDYQEVS